MTVNKRILLLCLLAMTTFINAKGATSDLAESLVLHLVNHKFSKAYKTFDKITKKQITKSELEKMWLDKEKDLGRFKRIGKITKSHVQGLTKNSVPLSYEKGEMEVILFFNKKNKLVGLSFALPQYAPPPEAVNKVFGKEKVVIKTDSFEMPGELLLPMDCNQCPVAIILQGSGPANMDGSSPSNPNRPYLDLAYGLALNGIASIRYDKRTYRYGKRAVSNGNVTLESEYIEDALSAIKLAKTYNFLDTTKMFIIGHSLGAYTAPIIAQRDSNIAGIVVLAGPVRPLYEVIPDQYEFLLQLDGEYSKSEKALVDSIREEVLFIQKKPSKVTMIKHLGGEAMLPYFEYIREYDPIETIKSISCRVLITQGNRDYQVRYDQEYNVYLEQLDSQSHVDFKLFEGLNHLLMWGDKPSTPNEYSLPGHVDKRVPQYLANWIFDK